ncbi:MAG TPA: S8 family serine peptidase [Gemmatimonadales bacterium]|nr:S8 family serine peptidase [Gemmatimonadales bacterium]
MPRRIVLIRGHDPLQAAWRQRSFGPAGPLLERVKVAGVMFDDAYHPVQVLRRSGAGDAPPAASGFNYGGVGAVDTYVVRVEFDDEDAIERLRRERATEIDGVFADPTVSPFPYSYCGDAAIGATRDVARRLGVPALRRARLTGGGVHVAVVDTGIDGSRIPVAGGWAPTPGYVSGSSAPNHGTMVAYDVQIAAPDAQIFDYALFRSHVETWAAFLSDAIAAFADLVERVTTIPGRWVVNNSWGLFDRSSDAPIGTSENYSANPDHPFNQITGALVAAGADVFFAAGNCGADCPDGRCGSGDTGSGASIHGANSHPDVVTVAAVTVTDRRLGYSSQGPGALYSRKPDLAGFSHFTGSGIYPVDGGTSAASPVAAGVAAALRQRFPADRLAPAQLKGLLQRTARDLRGEGWDYDLGYGVIDAAAALKALGMRSGSRTRRSPKARRRVKTTA